MRAVADGLAACLSDETIAAWLSTELPAAERERAIEHAASCARCRAAIAGLAGAATRAPLQLGRYEIEEPLGAGGMGVVFRGRDVVLDRAVAIKMLRASLVEPAHRERMLREAQAMAKISHPNVVTVHELGEAGGEVFVAMELVVGTMLHRWLAAPRSVAERVAVALGVGRGIAAVHAAGLLHRDIKPDNVIVRADGNPVVVDFGLARVVGAVARGSGSARAGTPHYLAPEIVAGGVATAASDQYQWWAIVDETLAELPRARARAIAPVLARGRDPDPGRRFASMTEAVEALERALAAPRGRGRRGVVIGGFAAVAAVAAGIALWPAARAGPACDPVAPDGWSATRRAAIERGLRAANLDPARVLAALDARVATTSTLRARACRARDGTADPRPQWPRRMVCLDETWAATRRQLAGLESTDPATVRGAVDELSEVMSAERCARGSLPAIAEPLPAEPRKRYEVLVAQVREVERDTRLTPTQRAARLRAMEPAIAALRYPPLDARWSWAIGHALADARDVDAAAREYGRSAQAALAAGEDNVYVRALIVQLQVTSTTASADQVAALERQAIAGARRLDNPQIDAQLVLARAEVQQTRGDNVAARALFEQADRLYGELSLSAHAMHVSVLQNLGGICLELVDLAAAEGYLDRAVALARVRYGETSAPYWEARGARATAMVVRKQLAAAELELRAAVGGLAATAPDSSQLGVASAYLCAVLLVEDRIAEARTECAASVAATRSAIGADSPSLVWPLLVSGQVELRADAPGPALGFLRRAMTFVDAGQVRPIVATTTRTYLAIALRAAHQTTAARTLANQVAPALVGPELAEARGDFVEAFPELAGAVRSAR